MPGAGEAVNSARAARLGARPHPRQANFDPPASALRDGFLSRGPRPIAAGGRSPTPITRGGRKIPV